jgi:hypothetical protein
MGGGGGANVGQLAARKQLVPLSPTEAAARTPLPHAEMARRAAESRGNGTAPSGHRRNSERHYRLQGHTGQHSRR